MFQTALNQTVVGVLLRVIEDGASTRDLSVVTHLRPLNKKTLSKLFFEASGTWALEWALDAPLAIE